ncbi:unnamed protein product [Chrysoparadoxa australica]
MGATGSAGPKPLVQRVHDLLVTEREGVTDEAALKGLLEDLNPKDVGLEEGSFIGIPEAGLYLPIVESPSFDMAVFIIPAGSGLPIHDHPSMSVYSKVLFGKMFVRSFDLLGHSSGKADGKGGASWQAKLSKAEAVSSHTPCFSLGPRERNLHSFHAETTCAVFDVLLPPYDSAAGRSCHYYEIDEKDGEDELAAGDIVELYQVQEPDGLPSYYPYTGPVVQRGSPR